MQNISIKTENSDVINNLCRIYSKKILADNILNVYTDDVYLLSNNLSTILVDVYEKKLIYNIICKKIKDKTSREEVFKRVVDYIYDSEYEFSDYFRKIRNKIIIDAFLNYFNSSDYINIEGFLSFRLGEYIDELVDIISVCEEELLIDNEYNNFIDMLREYVVSQKSRYRKMELIIKFDDLLILNESGENITHQCILNCVSKDLDIVAKFEDLILNVLINNAPKEIVIHDPENILNSELIKTISKIFYDRLKVCNDCILCKTNN
ncbi:MAG: putative sporulation protein YtxC [Clostridia bacterium]|nr:putative sporulation protein YtxC [Clostridia bacterium]